MKVLKEAYLEVFDQLTDFEENKNQKNHGDFDSESRIEQNSSLPHTSERDIANKKKDGEHDTEFNSRKDIPNQRIEHKRKKKEVVKLKVISGGGCFQIVEKEMELNDEYPAERVESQKIKSNVTQRWLKSSTSTADCLTLIRHTVYCILAYHGVVLREFVSKNENLNHAAWRTKIPLFQK